METYLSLAIGLGLAAACGFRVFVPLLALSIASNSGHVTLDPFFAWIGTTPAMIAFSLATALEIAGYYIPWVDHFLDTVATPAAVVAGTVVTAAMVSGMSPFLQWSTAIIAGGGIAGIIQASTVVARAVSSATTVGVANPVVATAELGLSSTVSFLSILAPWLAMIVVLALAGFVAVRIRRKRVTAPPAVPPVLEQARAAQETPQ